MARPSSPLLTDRESQIMDTLWELGQATAEQVRQRLPVDLHDSTVRTLLRVLTNKGYVRRKTKAKAHIYRPAKAKLQVQNTALKNILTRFFDGSAEALVLRMLENEEITSEQLEELRHSKKQTPQ